MSIDFLYLSEEDMIRAGVLEAGRCVKTMEDVMSLFGKGDYIMGGPKGDEHGLKINFPKAKDIADF
ncbi:MAG: ornithine cyclodeaminase, partial [Lachnospiraceae bacterium]|nr:ornithine cyclodeaminase [Lachnospiraceae bacterium]